MHANKTSHSKFLVLFAALLVLLAACQPAESTTLPQPTAAPTEPAATQTAVPATAEPTAAPTQTQAQPTAVPTMVPQPTAEATQSSSTPVGELTMNYSTVATDLNVETIAAQDAGSGGPYWGVAPQYRLVTLQGYPIPKHLLKPQVFVYPAADLAPVNQAMGKMATDLQTLLQTQQAGDHLPFLPLFNAQQVFYTHVQYLDFKNGKGVRFITQFDQAFLPINNYELIYTFQGLTSDGKYYIAVVLPITNPELPAGAEVNEQMAKELSDFPAYLSKTVNLLASQPSTSFTPNLDKLDAMVHSIEVK